MQIERNLELGFYCADKGIWLWPVIGLYWPEYFRPCCIYPFSCYPIERFTVRSEPLPTSEYY